MELQKPKSDESRRIKWLRIALVVIALTIVVVLVTFSLLGPTMGDVYAPYIVNAL